MYLFAYRFIDEKWLLHLQDFFSHWISAILHKENFVNIALFILIGEFENFPSDHNDSNKMKGKNKIQIKIHLLAP